MDERRNGPDKISLRHQIECRIELYGDNRVHKHNWPNDQVPFDRAAWCLDDILQLIRKAGGLEALDKGVSE